MYAADQYNNLSDQHILLVTCQVNILLQLIASFTDWEGRVSPGHSTRIPPCIISCFCPSHRNDDNRRGPEFFGPLKDTREFSPILSHLQRDIISSKVTTPPEGHNFFRLLVDLRLQSNVPSLSTPTGDQDRHIIGPVYSTNYRQACLRR